MRRICLLAAVLAPAPALALTPEELWSAWQAQAAGFGVTLQAEATEGTDGSLVLSDFSATEAGVDDAPAPLPPDFPIRTVILRPAPDGVVEIDLGLPDRGTIPGGAEELGDLLLEEDGLRITARDGTDAIEYELLADSLRAASLPPAGGSDLNNFAVEVWGVRLRLPGEFGPDRTAEASLSVDGTAYVVNSGDPEFGMASAQAGRIDGRLAIDGTMTLPEGMTFATLEETDFAEALERGLSLRLAMVSDAATQQASFEGFPFSYRYESVSEPGRADLLLDRDALAASGRYDGGTLALTSPDLPFPSLDIAYGPVEAELAVPLGAEPGDLRYLFSVEDLAFGEEAWAALDPQGLLPREPLNLVLDLGGRMALGLASLMAAEEGGTEPPVPVVESVELRRFELSGAGLRATASGSLAFDNAMGQPVPTVGSGTARLEGADRLLDALVAAGWITAEDARNARLGLAAAFRPGEAPDTRQATVELRPDGTVWANGVQLQ